MVLLSTGFHYWMCGFIDCLWFVKWFYIFFIPVYWCNNVSKKKVDVLKKNTWLCWSRCDCCYLNTWLEWLWPLYWPGCDVWESACFNTWLISFIFVCSFNTWLIVTMMSLTYAWLWTVYWPMTSVTVTLIDLWRQWLVTVGDCPVPYYYFQSFN